MKCKDFGSMIHELVSGRVADKTKQLEALEHAGQCLWCARRLDEENKLTERLHAFAAALQAQRAPLRVEAELLQAFRERNVRSATPILGPAWTRLWQGVSWGLALAAIVVTAWMILIEWPHLHRSHSATAPRAAKNRPGPGADAAPVTGKPGPSQPRAALQSDSASEATTDFISLGTCDDSQCMEEATLVRVALPAEALLAFGLGTDSEYAPDALVQADVALGTDGVPFAIRFVN